MPEAVGSSFGLVDQRRPAWLNGLGSAFLAALLALVLTGCSTPLGAALGSGAPAPRVSLAIDPADSSLLRAGAGLFRSRDQGQTWQPVPLPTNVGAERIGLVAAAGARPSAIYLGGSGVGIFRSNDAGQSWTSVGEKLPSQDVRSLAVHTFRPETLYATIPGQGVFRTEDAGNRWQKMDDGPDDPVIVLAHSRLEGSMNTGWLYAATPDAPYLSMDCF